MAHKPKSQPAAPAAPAAPASEHARPHVDLPALPAAVLSQSTAPQPLLIYRSGQLIGVFIPIDAELWSGAGDGEYASYDLQSTASRVGSDLAFDWYSNIFDSQLGSEALARQIAHSHRRFRIDPQDNKPK